MAAQEPGNLNILNWAEDDRPREKLLRKGKEALSDAELIAVLLGSGTRSMSAVELAKLILKQSRHNLHELAKLSVQDLMKFKGVGEAKAISIVCALEIGRRRNEAPTLKKPDVRSSKELYQYMKPVMLDLHHEEFWVIAISNAGKAIHRERISSGATNKVLVDHKRIIKTALDHRASQIAIAHNHPSGNKRPSQEDRDLTDVVNHIARLMGMPLLDHLIFTDTDYYSFNDEGLLS